MGKLSWTQSAQVSFPRHMQVADGGRWRSELTTRCRQLAVWLCITTIVSSLLLAGVLGLLWLTVEEEVNHHIPRLAWQQSRAHLQTKELHQSAQPLLLVSGTNDQQS